MDDLGDLLVMPTHILQRLNICSGDSIGFFRYFGGKGQQDTFLWTNGWTRQVSLKDCQQQLLASSRLIQRVSVAIKAISARVEARDVGCDHLFGCLCEETFREEKAGCQFDHLFEQWWMSGEAF